MSLTTDCLIILRRSTKQLVCDSFPTLLSNPFLPSKRKNWKNLKENGWRQFSWLTSHYNRLGPKIDATHPIWFRQTTTEIIKTKRKSGSWCNIGRIVTIKKKETIAAPLPIASYTLPMNFRIKANANENCVTVRRRRVRLPTNKTRPRHLTDPYYFFFPHL